MAQTCPLCMAPLRASQSTTMTCGHTYCRSCLVNWWNAAPSHQNQCPGCRTSTTAMSASVASLSGLGFANVAVHHGSTQPAQLNALAYAQGSDIHLAPSAEAHLPHEAWHVVQQMQGRVRPTLQM